LKPFAKESNVNISRSLLHPVFRRFDFPRGRSALRRVVSLMGLTLGFAPLMVGAQTVKWDLAAAYPATNFHTENLVQFAADVAKASGGKLNITVHPNASLFKAPEIKRAVQSGQSQLGEVLLVNFENEHPLFGLDGVPFLATSYAASRKLAQVQQPALAELLARQGMKLLYTVAWPPQGLYSKRPVVSGADLKGSKWRAYSPATAKIADLLGAQPVTVQSAELTQALATGVVESFITSGATGFDSKVYEHVKYYYDMHAWLPKNAVIVNTKSFDSLDGASQKAVLDAAALAEQRGWKVSEEKTQWFVEQLRSKGMEISPPSARLTEDMAKIGAQLQVEWKERMKKSNADGEGILNAFMGR